MATKAVILWTAVMVAVIFWICEGKGLGESSRTSSSKTYKLNELNGLGVSVITNAKDLDGGKCPDGADEVTNFICIQGHAKLWSSKLCSGAEDASSSKCQKECTAWVLQQGNRTLVPVAEQHQYYIPGGASEGNETAPAQKCLSTNFDKSGGKCKCWVCLVRLEV